MKARITVTMDNAAFDGQSGVELACILRKLAEHCEAAEVLYVGDRWPTVDANGNTVGELKVTK